MKSLFIKSALAVALPLFGAMTASAHLTYGGRNLGTYTGLTAGSLSIPGQIVTSPFGWADGTDDDFGDSHKLRGFRFTLQNTALVTLSVQNTTGMLPGFSIYAGLAHVSPFLADHDTSPVSLSYLATLPTPKEGVFDALHTFKMGNDDTAAPAPFVAGSLSTFTFIGYAVDGTSANFGSTPGIVGDGVANGFVSGTYELGAGDYTVLVGGADYGAQLVAGQESEAYFITTSISVAPVPEPIAMTSALLGAALLGLRRSRRGR